MRDHCPNYVRHTDHPSLKQDLVMSAYRPNSGLEERFKLEAGEGTDSVHNTAEYAYAVALLTVDGMTHHLFVEGIKTAAEVTLTKLKMK